MQRANGTYILDDQFTEKAQWLTHIFSGIGYRHFQIDFPSEQIRQKFLDSSYAGDASHLALQKLKRSNSYTAMGWRYEWKILHSHLTCNGVVHKVQEVDGSNEHEIEILKRVFYRSGDQITSVEENTLYQPVMKTATSIDAVYPPFMIQITRATKHSMKEDGVEAVKSIFCSVNEWYLLWVIPPFRKENPSYCKKNKLFKNTFVLLIEESDVTTTCYDDKSSSEEECDSMPLLKKQRTH